MIGGGERNDICISHSIWPRISPSSASDAISSWNYSSSSSSSSSRPPHKDREFSFPFRFHSNLAFKFVETRKKTKKKRVQGPQKADSSQRQREARPFMSHTPKRFRRSSSPQALSRPVVISTVVGGRSKPFASPRFCGS